MIEHLASATLNLMADGELTPEQMAEVNAHLAGCPACTADALAQMMLKSATARAGHRYAVPAGVRGRGFAGGGGGGSYPPGARGGGCRRGAAGVVGCAGCGRV